MLTFLLFLISRTKRGNCAINCSNSRLAKSLSITCRLHEELRVEICLSQFLLVRQDPISSGSFATE
jgi:hypothetical protein